MKITIVHLYPDLLNHYGDAGNIIVLKKRLEDRGIEANVVEYGVGENPDFRECDILYIGGGTDRGYMLAYKALLAQRDAIKSYVEEGKSLLAVCNGFEMLGKEFEYEDKMHQGLGVLDIVVKQNKTKLIGNIVTHSPLIDYTIAGFENHTGILDPGSYTPLGNVVYGHGNNGMDKTEGIVYKGLIGTYIHGPLLPKNPRLADCIIQNALNCRYDSVSLTQTDDSIEERAHNYILEKYAK